MSIVEGIGSHFIARSRLASYEDALSFPNTMLCMLSLERLNQSPSIPPNACFPPFLAHQAYPHHSPLLCCRNPTQIYLIHRTQQLRLQYEFAFLVLLRRLVRLVVLPPHRLLALPAHYIPHDVPTRRHVAFAGVRLRNVHDGVEEVGFAVLAAEVLRSSEQSALSTSPCRDRV